MLLSTGGPCHLSKHTYYALLFLLHLLQKLYFKKTNLDMKLTWKPPVFPFTFLFLTLFLETAFNQGFQVCLPSKINHKDLRYVVFPRRCQVRQFDAYRGSSTDVRLKLVHLRTLYSLLFTVVFRFDRRMY
jgi:hypothetical protein